MDIAPRWIPIWHPVMSAVYTGRSLPQTWYPECQVFSILNADTLLQLKSEVCDNDNDNACKRKALAAFKESIKNIHV
jgi:hypothetical protein